MYLLVCFGISLVPSLFLVVYRDLFLSFFLYSVMLYVFVSLFVLCIALLFNVMCFFTLFSRSLYISYVVF